MTATKETMTSPSSFPKNFTWGVATSAYQIEGAAREDGRGPSIWDTFSHTPGKVRNGDTGDVACDHYHRWREDVDLIAGLGVNAYRFSIAWPRVQPAGSGAWNEKGLDFYDRLVDRLLELGIAPHVTLYHWDLPQALQDKGGWASRDTCSRFAEYAVFMSNRLKDRVASIATHNEPWCTAIKGNLMGEFAPGIRDEATALQVAHHLLLSHGMAVHAMRAEGIRAPLGIVLNQSPAHPATQSPSDVAAASRAYNDYVRWYADPIFLGRYPEDTNFKYLPVIHENDFRYISEPLDFLGINYYTRLWVSSARPPVPPPGPQGFSDMAWETYPEGLTELLVGLQRDYTLPPIFITENGMACADQLRGDKVADPDRIAYLNGHLDAVARARAAGVDVRGYFYWSLFDNYEWEWGYDKRFGLVHVDYATQARTLKDSAIWYRDYIQRHGASHKEHKA
ncbi:MAG TPA: GH1 family beta-glucosidase [Rhodocyclaceae bacterium]|nr:GH1 family beta-glucosidase [Rhodocyclaceae bacterium]